MAPIVACESRRGKAAEVGVLGGADGDEPAVALDNRLRPEARREGGGLERRPGLARVRRCPGRARAAAGVVGAGADGDEAAVGGDQQLVDAAGVPVQRGGDLGDRLPGAPIDRTGQPRSLLLADRGQEEAAVGRGDQVLEGRGVAQAGVAGGGERPPGATIRGDVDPVAGQRDDAAVGRRDMVGRALHPIPTQGLQLPVAGVRAGPDRGGPALALLADRDPALSGERHSAHDAAARQLDGRDR